MKQAFSLVELSIVLVILGLLTGGILAGQSLIRASELRSVTTEYQRYVTATQTFRDKYFAIPGDMPNATRFWGDDNAACADGAIPNGSPGTCNGGGNGALDTAAAGANATSETFQYWKQLALAGLIEGNYSGLSGAGGANEHVSGSNAPPSKASNALWGTWHTGPGFVGTGADYALEFGNTLVIGTFNATAHPNGPAFRPEEAWNIDTKLDDGKPAQGKVISNAWNNGCAAADDGSHAANDFNASYRLTDTSPQCALRFRKAF